MTRDGKVITIVRHVLWLAALWAPGTALADGGGDGLYGRWDRSVSLSVAAGGGSTWIAGNPKGGVVADARLLFANAAGPVVAGRWAPDGGQHLFVGVDVRPLFPALFFIFAPTWNEFWDLFIQSLHVELGAGFLLDGQQSVGFSYGVGLGIPIVRPKRSLQNVMLRVGARRINVSPAFRQAPNPNRSEWTLYGTLAFTFGLPIRIGGWEPPRYRDR